MMSILCCDVVDRPAGLWDAKPGILPPRPGLRLHPGLSTVHGGRRSPSGGQPIGRREGHARSVQV